MCPTAHRGSRAIFASDCTYAGCRAYINDEGNTRLGLQLPRGIQKRATESLRNVCYIMHSHAPVGVTGRLHAEYIYIIFISNSDAAFKYDGSASDNSLSSPWIFLPTNHQRTVLSLFPFLAFISTISAIRHASRILLLRSPPVYTHHSIRIRILAIRKCSPHSSSQEQSRKSKSLLITPHHLTIPPLHLHPHSPPAECPPFPSSLLLTTARQSMTRLSSACKNSASPLPVPIPLQTATRIRGRSSSSSRTT